jgi:hypothetical protein
MSGFREACHPYKESDTVANETSRVLLELQKIRGAVEAIKDEIEMSGLPEVCDAIRAIIKAASPRSQRPKSGRVGGAPKKSRGK